MVIRVSFRLHLSYICITKAKQLWFFIPDIFICVFYIFGDGVQFPGEVDILVNLPSECESIP